VRPWTRRRVSLPTQMLMRPAVSREP
jgi:hypothetical protein